MGEWEGQIFLTEEFQITYVDTPSRRWSLICSSPPHPTPQYHRKCKLHLVTHFQRRGRKGKNCNSSMKKPSKHHLIHVMKVHITSDAMWIPHIPWYDEIKREVDLCGILSTNPQPQSNYKKNIRQTQTEGHSTGYLVSNCQDCQGHEKQGKSEKLSQIRGIWGDRTTKQCATLNWINEQKEDINGKTGEIQINSGI